MLHTKFRATPAVASLALFASLATPVGSQTIGGSFTPLRQWAGPSANGAFGASVSAAGDINGDGIPDTLAGSWAASSGAMPYSGSVFAYSGVDGSLLYQWNGDSPGQGLGYSVAGAGDVNGDGFDDVIVGGLAVLSPDIDAGLVRVYSGANGLLLHEWVGSSTGDGLGYAVSGAGDVNGDGLDDVIFSAPFSNSLGNEKAGEVYVRSGADGSLLHYLNGTAQEDWLGSSVAAAGDLDGDGFDDVLVSSVGSDPGGLVDAGQVFLLSGATGQAIHHWTGSKTNQRFGTSVSTTKDATGDGIRDIVVGAGFSDVGSLVEAGSAFLYSGVHGGLVHQWDGAQAGDHFGQVVSGAGDVDGDGFGDVLVGAPDAGHSGLFGTGAASLHSGFSGQMLHTARGSAQYEYFASAVSGAGDVDGDGFDEVLIGAWAANKAPLGAPHGGAYLYSFRPFLYASAKSVSVSAGTVLDLTLDFPIDAQFSSYKVLLSASGTGPTQFGVAIPLAVDQIVIDSFFGTYPVAMHANLHGALDATGAAQASMTFPAGLSPALVGLVGNLAAISSTSGLLPELSSAAVAFVLVP